MRLKPTTSVALFLMFLLVAHTTLLAVTNDVNTTMLTSETNDEDSFSVSARNGYWSTPISLDSTDNVGYDSSLAIDSNDNFHVTYLYYINENLAYMTFYGSSLTTPVSPLSTHSVVYHSSLAIDSNDNLHVTYLDNTTGNLKYITY